MLQHMQGSLEPLSGSNSETAQSVQKCNISLIASDSNYLKDKPETKLLLHGYITIVSLSNKHELAMLSKLTSLL